MHMQNQNGKAAAAGFSLIELLVAMSILLIVAAAAMGAVIRMMKTQGKIMNRTGMHAGVRNATELLTQEIGQAGRLALPAPVTLSAAVTVGSHAVTVSPNATGMFNGMYLQIGGGSNAETVAINTVTSSGFTATFQNAHAANEPVFAFGVFASGIVPYSGAPSFTTDGSTDNILKLYGDINGDGQMQYVEYTCDTTANTLTRNAMSAFATTKTPTANAPVLVSGLIRNDSGGVTKPCFIYQEYTPNNSTYFVMNVAMTVSVQTETADVGVAATSKEQETKALLNIGPRNIYQAAFLLGEGATTRIQPIPPTVQALLH